MRGTLSGMPGGIGPLELGIVLLIILVIFGPKRLPGLGKQLGGGMREFKESLTGGSKDDDDDDDEARPELSRASSTEPAAVTADKLPADEPAKRPAP